jgi:hypothetical protein
MLGANILGQNCSHKSGESQLPNPRGPHGKDSAQALGAGAMRKSRLRARQILLNRGVTPTKKPEEKTSQSCNDTL